MLCGAAAESSSGNQKWLPARADKLPKWRGFNLLEKFSKGWSNRPFVEEDFRLVRELGFNFVRLPMDYRVWIKDGDWTRFDEGEFHDIDEAVGWGKKYGIHVCINFHRAPGYTVASPKEKMDLWTEPEAQKVCAMHWAFFARRYRGIPNERLSFNLINEPSNVDGKTYAQVAKKLVEAIRAEDPERLIIADGLRLASKPCFELIPLNVAQATRGYSPMGISHYQAHWISGWDQMSKPTWPFPPTSGYLYGPGKQELQSPLRLECNFTESVRLRLRVGTVSRSGRLTVKADGKMIWEKMFVCGPGKGKWKKSVYKPQWKIYQNVYDRDYTTTVPAGTQVIELENIEGDWVRLIELGFQPVKEGDTKEHVLDLPVSWGRKQEPVCIVDNGDAWFFKTKSRQDKSWLWENYIRPWQELESKGCGVMVGEWGAYNKTPHDVTLRWMEDCLKNWQKAGWGWALWCFRGGFGILDSNRPDVEYEEWHGHKLDRKMLDLLQKY